MGLDTIQSLTEKKAWSASQQLVNQFKSEQCINPVQSYQPWKLWCMPKFYTDQWKNCKTNKVTDTCIGVTSNLLVVLLSWFNFLLIFKKYFYNRNDLECHDFCCCCNQLPRCLQFVCYYWVELLNSFQPLTQFLPCCPVIGTSLPTNNVFISIIIFITMAADPNMTVIYHIMSMFAIFALLCQTWFLFNQCYAQCLDPINSLDTTWVATFLPAVPSDGHRSNKYCLSGKFFKENKNLIFFLKKSFISF